MIDEIDLPSGTSEFSLLELEELISS